LIHLVAVSGSNVTLVVSVLMPLAFAFGARRRSAFIWATVGIVAFLGFVGASASVVRAGIMGWFALLAREFGRLPKPEHLLVCAAVFLCLFNPRTLAFDAGFHLSMLATWGLLAWSKPFEERLTFVPSVFGFRSGLATTIAVTLMLFPYALWMFGTYSVAGLLTNLVALPMVSWVMFFGFVSVIVPDILASVASIPVAGFLHVLQFLADLGAKLPKMETSKSSVWILLASYGAIFLIDRRLRYPQSHVFGVSFLRVVGEFQQRVSKKCVHEIGPSE
jgi:competence protein ComEC